MTRSRDFAQGATRTEFIYTATAGQTSFSGNDTNSVSLAYTAGQIDVYLNGSRLAPADYTATNGTAVVLGVGAEASDTLQINAFGTFNVANVVATRDLEGNEFVLDDDGDTTITADTDDQIDIKIAGADDFKFTANTFNILSGSTLAIDSGATIANSGTATGFGGGSIVKMSVDEVTAEANGSGVYSDTGLSVAITPASTDNKIMLLATGVIGLNAMAAFRFMQGSSAINQADTPGSNTNRILSSFKTTAPNLNGSQNFVGSTIIAASATSELTFKLQVQADATPSPGNWFLNRSFNASNSDDASHAVATSYLYAIEFTGGNVSIDT